MAVFSCHEPIIFQLHWKAEKRRQIFELLETKEIQGQNQKCCNKKCVPVLKYGVIPVNYAGSYCQMRWHLSKTNKTNNKILAYFSIWMCYIWFVHFMSCLAVAYNSWRYSHFLPLKFSPRVVLVTSRLIGFIYAMQLATIPAVRFINFLILLDSYYYSLLGCVINGIGSLSTNLPSRDYQNSPLAHGFLD